MMGALPLSIFPEWFPTEVALVGLGVFVLSLFIINRDRSWAWNVIALDTPLVIGVGAAIVAGSSVLSDVAGSTAQIWMVLGAIVAFGGVAVQMRD